MSDIRIDTPRLTLRPPARQDTVRLTALINDVDIARMTTHIPHPYGPAEAEAFLALAEAGRRQGDLHFLIEHPGEGVVGGLGLMARQAGTEIGYWLGRPYWGQGLATEAVKAALAWAARTGGRRQVHAWHFNDNPASGWVLTKAGFLYTGVRRCMMSAARGAAVSGRGMIWLA